MCNSERGFHSETPLGLVVVTVGSVYSAIIGQCHLYSDAFARSHLAPFIIALHIYSVSTNKVIM